MSIEGSPEFRSSLPERIQLELDKASGMSPVLGRYLPEYAGSGSEHMVFNVQDHPKVVVKVNRESLGSRPADLKSAMALEIKRNRKQQQEFEVYFPDSVLAERPTYFKLPVTAELIKIGLKNQRTGTDVLPEGLISTWAMGIIQERAPDAAFADEHSHSLNFRYLEKSSDLENSPDLTPASYARWNADLLDEQAELGPEYLRSLGKEQAVLVESMEHDPTLRVGVREFIDRAIEYTEQTKKILDLAGNNNVVIFNDQADHGDWRVLLLDAKYPVTPREVKLEADDPDDFLDKQGVKLWQQADGLLNKFQASWRLSPEECSTLRNVLNYARYVNALAACTGTQRRLHFIGLVGDKSQALFPQLERSSNKR